MKITIQDFLKNGFVISCSKMQEKDFRKRFTKEFGEENLPRTYDGRPMKCSLGNTPNLIRCTYSHFELVKMAKALDLPFIMIYEDDAYPMSGAMEKMDKWLQDTEIPDDADILMLGNLAYIYDFQNCMYHCQPTSQIALARVSNQGLSGAHAYMVFRRCYDRYIALQTTSEKLIPPDGMFATKHTKDIVVYSCVPSFFIQKKHNTIQYHNFMRDKQHFYLFENSITQLMSFATLHTGCKMPNAHERWSRQIEHLKHAGLVKDGKIYSEDDLDRTWNDRFGKYASDRGYAYWSWKPYLIKQLMDKMQYGETLCYFDGGCVFPSDNAELEKLGEQIIWKLNTIGKDGYDIGLTYCRGIPCGYITRQEIVDKMGLTGNREFLYQFPHWQTGLVLIVKTPRAERLINDWVQFIFDNYESCIHFPFNDRSGQIKGFIHNGSDQAIFQCLLYKGQYRIMDLNDFLYRFIKRQKN